ncbi:hypothetical protein LDL49_14680 [Nonomuraea sp. NEAU-L178]|nr:hypothetical protein [Nonomuraea aurantiaca]
MAAVGGQAMAHLAGMAAELDEVAAGTVGRDVSFGALHGRPFEIRSW